MAEARRAIRNIQPIIAERLQMYEQRWAAIEGIGELSEAGLRLNVVLFGCCDFGL